MTTIQFGDKPQKRHQRHVRGEWWDMLLTENEPLKRKTKAGIDIVLRDYELCFFSPDAQTGEPVDLLVIKDVSREELTAIRNAINWMLEE